MDNFARELNEGMAYIQAEIKAKNFYYIDSILQKLIAFIKDCDISEIEEDTLPNKKKQYIAKDLKICDKLFTIVKQMGIKILEEIFKKDKAEN